MKKLLPIIYTFTILLVSTNIKAQSNPDFYLAPNGVTCMCPNANIGDTGTLTINGVQKTFTKRTRIQLDNLIETNPQDPEIALTCTSGITDMYNLFEWVTFNQDISSWDVSNVTDMGRMFLNTTSFNQSLNDWDVSSVTNMRWMFALAETFNQPLNEWDVSNVMDMERIFYNANTFNQPLDNWDVTNLTDMEYLFYGAISFNQPINTWDVSNATNMGGMFTEAESFNQPLNDWDVSNVTSMSSMFYDATSFNQPLNDWDVSNVTDMISMFEGTSSFNQDISNWCVEQIPQEPTEFSLNSPLQSDYKPIWGGDCENLSINNESLKGFDIYPNPAGDIVNFNWNFSNTNLKTEISIFDLNGKSLYHKIFDTQPENLNIEFLNEGTYILSVKANNTSTIRKVIKL